LKLDEALRACEEGLKIEENEELVQLKEKILSEIE